MDWISRRRACFVCLFSAVCLVAACKRGNDRPTLSARNDAFVPWADAELSKTDRDGINLLLKRLSTATGSGDASGASALFDTERMIEVLSRKLKQRFGPKDRQDIQASLSKTIASGVTDDSNFDAWNRYEPRSIALSSDGRDAILFVRTWDKDGAGSGKRLWLNKDGNTWTIYDYEDHDICLSFLTAWCAGAKAVLSDLTAMRTMMVFSQIPDALQQEDYEAAGALLSDIENEALPPELDALRWLFLAIIKTQELLPEEALAALDRALSVKPDLPIAHLLRAKALNQLDRPKEAISAVKRYHSFVGDDADGYLQIGIARLAMGEKPAAVEAFRRGLTDTPGDPDLIHALGNALEKSELAELGREFKKAVNPAAIFETICVLFLDDENFDAIDVLVAARYEQAASDSDALYYDAFSKRHRGDLKSASSLFLKSMKNAVDEESREIIAMEYFSIMIDRNKPVTAFKEAGDAAAAYQFIAGQLFAKAETDPKSQSVKQLMKLNDEFAKSSPEDPWLLYYRAELHTLTNEFGEADPLYPKAIGFALDVDDQKTFRDSWILSRYKAGRAKEAYAEIQPQTETFVVLADQMLIDKKYKKLRGLIAAHSEIHGDDPEIPYYDVELAVAENRHADAVETLETRRDQLLHREFGTWWYHRSRVRSLIALSKWEEALAAAEAAADANEFWSHHRLTLWVHAASGNAPDAIAAFEKLLDEEGYLAQALYDSDDLGPHLKSDAMAPLREKHPPAADEPNP